MTRMGTMISRISERERATMERLFKILRNVTKRTKSAHEYEARLCVLSQSVVAGHVAGRRVWVIGRHGLPVLVGRRLLAMIVSIAVAGTRCHGSTRTKARGTTANHRPPTAVPSTT